MIDVFKFLVVAVAGLTLGMWALVYLFQDSLLFFPPGPGGAGYASLPGVEAVELKMADGTRLLGYFAKPASAGPLPLLIYFGGNAEEVSPMVAESRRFPGHALLVINYRGYGASEGKPSEHALFADALEIYDYAKTRRDIDPLRITAMGRSLGTGVAVLLAAQRSVESVILVTPYDSMVEVARVHYRWLPASLLLKHRFDSVSRAVTIHAPLLMLTASNDEVIPRPRSDALFAAWAGPKSRLEIAGADHNSVDAYPDYWSAIANFLQTPAPAKS